MYIWKKGRDQTRLVLNGWPGWSDTLDREASVNKYMESEAREMRNRSAMEINHSGSRLRSRPEFEILSQKYRTGPTSPTWEL